MPLTLSDLTRLVSTLAPPEWAEPWDNVGLQAGDPDAPVERALVALECTPATLAEAQRRGAQAIITHHPLIFKPLKSAAATGRVGQLLHQLIRGGIGLIAAHTNLDKSPAGPNCALAEILGVEIEDWLVPEYTRDQCKLVVFVPEGLEPAIIDAIGRGGGGIIGDYSRCSFRAPGTGTFLGGASTNPAIGQSGRFEEVKETRLESVVPKRHLQSVLKEVLAAHPYEEPAYDIYPLEPGLARAGLGIVGKLKKPQSLQELLANSAPDLLKPHLPRSARRHIAAPIVIGPPRARLRRVAIVTGAGGSLVETAARAGADLLLTGELTYHQRLEAESLGLHVLALGHYETEAAAMPFFAKALSKATNEIRFMT